MPAVGSRSSKGATNPKRHHFDMTPAFSRCVAVTTLKTIRWRRRSVTGPRWPACCFCNRQPHCYKAQTHIHTHTHTSVSFVCSHALLPSWAVLNKAFRSRKTENTEAASIGKLSLSLSLASSQHYRLLPIPLSQAILWGWPWRRLRDPQVF